MKVVNVRRDGGLWIVSSSFGRYLEGGSEYEQDISEDRSTAFEFASLEMAEAWKKNLNRDYPEEKWDVRPVE